MQQILSLGERASRMDTCHPPPATTQSPPSCRSPSDQFGRSRNTRLTHGEALNGITHHLWSTDTDTDTGHDTDSDTPTQLIIWKNHIIQGNYKCRCRTRHVSDTGTRLIRGVSVLHRSSSMSNHNWNRPSRSSHKPTTSSGSHTMISSDVDDAAVGNRRMVGGWQVVDGRGEDENLIRFLSPKLSFFIKDLVTWLNLMHS